MNWFKHNGVLDVIDFKALQFRMDWVRKRLHISHSMRLTQTIGLYRQADTNLVPLDSEVLSPEMVSLWENAADLICRRESCMAELAALEFSAMYPQHVKCPRMLIFLITKRQIW